MSDKRIREIKAELAQRIGESLMEANRGEELHAEVAGREIADKILHLIFTVLHGRGL